MYFIIIPLVSQLLKFSMLYTWVYLHPCMVGQSILDHHIMLNLHPKIVILLNIFPFTQLHAHGVQLYAPVNHPTLLCHPLQPPSPVFPANPPHTITPPAQTDSSPFLLPAQHLSLQ
eukprot:GFUD01033104.1.p1 GENE.GFUD01033104.1~~GFUD01033104.1.p1  ORF type:complete len:116 (+),score=0.94 GFUD01033104.1:330-677(+)